MHTIFCPVVPVGWSLSICSSLGYIKPVMLVYASGVYICLPYRISYNILTVALFCRQINQPSANILAGRFICYHKESQF